MTFRYIFPQKFDILAPKLHSGAAIEIVKNYIFGIDFGFTLGDLFLHFLKDRVLSFKMQQTRPLYLS